MKKMYFYAWAAIVCLVGHESVAQNWQLVWQDEFNGSIGGDWVFETGTGSGGWGNNELQYYRRENATVENGNLVITARRENFGGQSYTSARMKTQGRKSFRYGKIEARMALPTGSGLWPAFWMLGTNITSVGWPACGEIDIMEHVNSNNVVHGTIHWQDNNGNYANYGGFTPTNINAYHTYAVEWTDRYIRWFVDGQQYHEVNIANGVNGTQEFHNNFFILLNLAVGGNWPGFNVDNGRLPARMLVDYVRVYQGSGGGGGGNNFSVRREAESYNAMLGVQTESCSEGGQNVGWIDQGDWMAFNNITIPSSGSYTIRYRVASPGGAQLSSDLNAGSIQLGTVNIPATGGWQNWTTVSQTVYLNAGTYSFGIYAPRSGWNINWWSIQAGGNARTATAPNKLAPAATLDEHVPAKLSVYPNPAEGELKVYLSDGHEHVSVYDQAGRRVEDLSVPSRGIVRTLDVSTLPAGLYLLKAQGDTGTESVKFIKR